MNDSQNILINDTSDGTPNLENTPKPVSPTLPASIPGSNSVSPQSPVKTVMPSSTPKILKPPILWEETQTALEKLQDKLGGVVLSYYTTTSMVGDDVKFFYTHLRKLGYQENLYFVIFSGGGDGKSAYRIAAMLRNYCKNLVIVVPEIAASAATMLSLAGDKIIMTPLAYLTAVDTSLVHPLNPKDHTNHPVRVELEEVRRSLENIIDPDTKIKDYLGLDAYKALFSYVHPVAFGSMLRASTLSENLCRDILSLRRDPIPHAQSEKLISKLNREYPSHGYPINREKAREIGLPVEDSDKELDSVLWNYINVCRYLTEPKRTDISESYFHVEKFVNMIESVGRRASVRNVYDKRVDPIIKSWNVLRDEYYWEGFYEEEKDGQKKGYDF